MAIIHELYEEVYQTALKKELREELGENASKQDIRDALDARLKADAEVDVRLVYRVWLAFKGTARYIDITFNKYLEPINAVYFDSSCTDVQEWTLTPDQCEVIADRYSWIKETRHTKQILASTAIDGP